MKKSFLVTFFVAIIVVAMLLFSLISAKDRQADQSSSNIPEVIYIVKEYEGKIGVFTEGSQEPVEVIEVQVEYLPVLDRDRLASGIYASSKQELQKILEDYMD